MITTQTKAESIVGQVEWQSENHGLCRCPGEQFHTSNTRVRDTTVFVDSVPTIFCWHTSCQAMRNDANYKLRKLILNDPLYRPLVAPMSTNGTNPMKLVIERDVESDIIQRIGVIAQSNRARYLAHYKWDPADMYEQSPAKLDDNPTNDYRMLVSLFKSDDIVWIGAVKDSGNHPQNFRAASEWMKLDEPVGQFITGSAFKAGTISRANENVDTRRFLVVESDELSKAEIGAVFQLMRDLFKMKLYAVVDTAGKSLHGWFDPMPNPEWEKQLKAFLVPMGCDPATFKPSQPVRVAGAKRDDKTQSLLWFCKEGK
jgi:hypothetical protein